VNVRNAPLILLVCAGSLAAGVLWLLAGSDEARRSRAVERGVDPSVAARVPSTEPTAAPDVPEAEPRQTQAFAPAVTLPQPAAFLGRVVNPEDCHQRGSFTSRE